MPSMMDTLARVDHVDPYDLSDAPPQSQGAAMPEHARKLTTASGRPYVENDNTMTVGPRGPILLQDYILHEKMAHFDRERIPERVVRAKGAGALSTTRRQPRLARGMHARLAPGGAAPCGAHRRRAGAAPHGSRSIGNSVRPGKAGQREWFPFVLATLAVADAFPWMTASACSPRPIFCYSRRTVPSRWRCGASAAYEIGTVRAWSRPRRTTVRCGWWDGTRNSACCGGAGHRVPRGLARFHGGERCGFDYQDLASSYLPG